MKQLDMFLVSQVMANHGLKTRSRWQPLVWKRYAFYNFMRSNNFTLSFIGEMVRLDHATIINGLKKYDELKRYDDFKAIVREIEEDLKACAVVDVDDFSMREVLSMVTLENLMGGRL